MTRAFRFTVVALVLGTTDGRRVVQQGQWDIRDWFERPDPKPTPAPPPVPPSPFHHSPIAEVTTQAPTTQAPTTHSAHTPPPDHTPFRWHYICNGYLDTATRTGDFGSGVGANDLSMCLAYCTAHNLCNAVTFDLGGTCWMNSVAAKPALSHCDHNAGGLSFWLGETDGSPFLSVAQSWQQVCNGYIQGDHIGRIGLGRVEDADATSLEACRDACDANWRCNTAVYDGGNCWIETIPLQPSPDDCNDASWAYSWWKGSATLTELETRSPSAVYRTPGHITNVGTPDPSCGGSQMRFDEGCFFKCQSDLQGQIAAPSKKGLALDDTTLHWCPDNIHFQWPNTNEPVTSFRMFKAWAPWWNEPFLSKENAWHSLKRFLDASNGRVLVGTQISCSEEQDDEDWENVKQMMAIFGPEHIMGLAIGNELELLWTKTAIYNETELAECLERIWNEGYFLNKFHARVRELDEMGEAFRNIPVTSVFGGFILAEPGWPFFESASGEQIARINTFINSVTYEYGDRYVHTVNLYPYFEEAFVEYDDPSSSDASCYTGLERALCMGDEDPNSCTLTWMIHRIRQRLHALGRPDATLWLGETGWSYPAAHTLATKMRQCPEWSSPAAKTHYYMNFLEWDMEMNATGYRGPDHIFYFAMRDSTNFGYQEGFGLIGDGNPHAWCSNTTCETQKSALSVTSAYEAAPPEEEEEDEH